MNDDNAKTIAWLPFNMRWMIVICLGLFAATLLLPFIQGYSRVPSRVVENLAVAMVAAGWSAVVAAALAGSLRRVAKRNVLVQTLADLKTLGAVTVIGSTQTSSFTWSEITVREIWTGGRRFRTTGSGYTPRGQFYWENGNTRDVVFPATDPNLLMTLTIGVLCNHARIVAVSEKPDHWHWLGDPMEGALLFLAKKGGIDPQATAPLLVDEIPFDSNRKMMSVVLRDSRGTTTLYAKGAPERILRCCSLLYMGGQPRPLAAEDRQQIMAENKRLTASGQRVLALAYRVLSADEATPATENELIFVGLVGIVDPPCHEAKEAIKTCREAGIRPVMMTGDQPDTALAIARQLKIIDVTAHVILGSELDAMSDEQLAVEAERTSVFARVTAAHKLRLLNAIKQRGEIVAIAGDSVNATSAEKSSDTALTNTDFATVVNAVEESRGIFDNIQKFVLYLLACNTAELLFLLIAAFLGWPLSLLPIQILWINLVINILPTLALAMESPETDIMQRPPRPAREPVVTWRSGGRMLLHGLLMAIVTLIAFGVTYDDREEKLASAQTAAFGLMAFAQIFYSLGCRSQRCTMLERGVLSNGYLLSAILLASLLQLCALALPFSQPIFQVAPLEVWQWGLILCLPLAPLSVVELGKVVWKLLQR